MTDRWKANIAFHSPWETLARFPHSHRLTTTILTQKGKNNCPRTGEILDSNQAQPFALVVNDQVQLETIEPAPTAFAPPGKAVKDARRVEAAVMADPDRPAVAERNTRRLALATL